MPNYEQFKMPDAGEGLTEADIITWHVKVGDTVTTNQPLLEIETAKSLVELPCPYDGVVVELLHAEGETVAVGDPIITVDVDPNGPPAGASGQGGVHVPDHHVAPLTVTITPTHDFSEVTQHVDSPVTAAIPTVVPVPAAQPAPVAATPAPAPVTPSAPPVATESASGAVLVGYGVSAGSLERRARKQVEILPTPVGNDDEYPVLAKPPVRKLARDLNVDLTTVSPSGPGGLVTREDVEQHAKSIKPQTLATYEGDDQPWLAEGVTVSNGRATRVPVKSVRKRTAEAMVTSAFSAPHVSVFHTVDVTPTMELVAKLKADREFEDVRVTPLLIAARALLFAVRRHPEINASWDEAAQEIVYKHYVNLGIAAATPRGLMVPNIKDAHRLDLHSLAVELGDLTQEARSGKTTPKALSDGTISITNVGVFGIDTGTPILVPGEAAILAFGAIRDQPWVHEGEIKIRKVTQLALSFDHRLVDGALGSLVLADVAAVLGDPTKALVWG